jgi:putative hemolysin
MLEEIGLEIFLIFILLIINGLFSMSEIAVVSARRIRLQQRADEGNTGAKTAIELASQPDRFLSTVQIGITLVGILSGAFGGAAIAEKLTPYVAQISFLANYASGISFGIVVLIITYFSLVIGELVPKNLALAAPETIASLMARPMQFVSKVTSPFVWFLTASTNVLLKLFRLGDSNDSAVTQEEIKAMISQGASIGVVDETEQELMESVFLLDDQRVTALMTTRLKVGWINTQNSVEQIKQSIRENPFSRLLVCDGDLDHVTGFVKAKDLLNLMLEDKPFDLGGILKQPLFVPETKNALEVLELFTDSLSHLAVVVDEFGLTQGIVTTNDLLEAIVGDLPVGGARNESVVKRDDGSYLIDGRLAAAEFRALLALKEFPAEERGLYETLAGFMIKRLEKMPAIGDKFEWEGYIFEIIDMDGKRVDRVLVTPVSVLS